MRFLSCAGELNHHGKYMCDSMYQVLGEDFKRITTCRVNKERLSLGYSDLSADIPYNSNESNADENRIRELIAWSDVVDFGAAPESYLHEAVRQNKIVFIRIERLLKEGAWKLLVPQVLMRYWRKYIQYRNHSNVYFLCISAYAANDLRKIGISGNRVLQWAYCPEFQTLDIKKRCHSSVGLSIVWIGRMIGWKHPETAVFVAEELKKRNIPFNMKMIGEGELLKKIQDEVTQRNLQDCVEVMGALRAELVRNVLKNTDIMLTTSDQNEGWGVVINEGMNSGCVVIASREMGAAPVLIQDGENGFLFDCGDYGRIADIVEDLQKNPQRIPELSRNAYNTIARFFSPDVYAETFVRMAEEALQNGEVSGGREHLGRILYER